MRSLVDARRVLAIFFVLLSILGSVVAFEVAPNSPCSAICNNAKADWTNPKGSSTQDADVMCSDLSFGGSNSTLKGRQFRGCMDCLGESNYVDKTSGEVDLFWYLFNMKFSAAWCVLGFTTVVNPVVDASEACLDTCGVFTNSFTDQLTSSNMSRQYIYCDESYGITQSDYDSCSSCLRNVPNALSLASYFQALGVACQQQPPKASTLDLNFQVVVTPSTDSNLAQAQSQSITTDNTASDDSYDDALSNGTYTSEEEYSASAATMHTAMIICVSAAVAGVLSACGALWIFMRRQKQLQLQRVHAARVAENHKPFRGTGFSHFDEDHGRRKAVDAMADMGSYTLAKETGDTDYLREKSLPPSPRKQSIYEMA